MKFLSNRIFSEYVKESYPEMIQFLEKFFDWMSKDNNGIAIIEKLSTNQDLTLSESNYISTIANTIANDFPISISNSLKLLLKQLRIIYRGKSSIECYKYLFEAFYNSEINITRPWDNVLKLNSSVYTTSKEMYISSSTSIKAEPIINNTYIFDEDVYFTINRHDYTAEDLVGWIIQGTTSGASAEMISISKSDDYGVVVLNKVSGTFQKSEPVILMNPNNGDTIENNLYSNTQIYVYEYTGENITERYVENNGIIIPSTSNWDSETGKLDSNMVLQDSKWYQEFSYTIESDISSAQWGPIISLLINPAGLTYRSKLTSSINNGILYYNREYVIDENNPRIYYNLLANDTILEKYSPDKASGRLALYDYMVATYPTSNNYGSDFTADELVYPNFVVKDKYYKKYRLGNVLEPVYNNDGILQYNNWFNNFSLIDAVDNSYHWNKSFYNPENYNEKYDKAAFENAQIQYGYYDKNGKWIEGIYDFDKFYKEYRIHYYNVDEEVDLTLGNFKITDSNTAQDKSRQIEYEKDQQEQFNSTIDNIYLYMHTKKELQIYLDYFHDIDNFMHKGNVYYKKEPGEVTVDLLEYAGKVYKINDLYENVNITSISNGIILDDRSVYINPDPDLEKACQLVFTYEYKKYYTFDSNTLNLLENITVNDIIYLADDNIYIKNITKDNDVIYYDEKNKMHLYKNIQYYPSLIKDSIKYSEKDNQQSILTFSDSILYNYKISDYYDYHIEYNFGEKKTINTLKNLTLELDNDTVFTNIKGNSLTLPKDQFSDSNVMIFTGSIYNSNFKLFKNLSLNTYITTFSTLDSTQAQASSKTIKTLTIKSIINMLSSTRKMPKVLGTVGADPNDGFSGVLQLPLEVSSTTSNVQFGQDQLIKIPENLIDIDSKNCTYIFNTATEYKAEEIVTIYNYKKDYFSKRLFLEKIGNSIDIIYQNYSDEPNANINHIVNDYITRDKSIATGKTVTQHYTATNSKVSSISVYLDKIVEKKGSILVFYNGLVTTSYNIDTATNNLGNKVTRLSNITYSEKSSNKISYEFIQYNLSELTLSSNITKDGQTTEFSDVNLEMLIDNSIINNGTANANISNTLFSKVSLTSKILNIFNALQTNPDMQIEIYILSDAYQHQFESNAYNHSHFYRDGNDVDSISNFVNNDVYTNNYTFGYNIISTFKTSEVPDVFFDHLDNIKHLSIKETAEVSYLPKEDNDNLVYDQEGALVYGDLKDNLVVPYNNAILTFTGNINNNYSVLSDTIDEYNNILFFGDNKELNYKNVNYKDRAISNDIDFTTLSVFPFKDTTKKSICNNFFEYEGKLYVHMSDYVTYVIDNNEYYAWDKDFTYTEDDTTYDVSQIRFNDKFMADILSNTTVGSDKLIDQDYMLFLNGTKILEEDISVNGNSYSIDKENFLANYTQNTLWQKLNIDNAIPENDIAVLYKNALEYSTDIIENLSGDSIVYCYYPNGDRTFMNIEDIVPEDNYIVSNTKKNHESNVYQYNKKYLVNHTSHKFTTPVDNIKAIIDVDKVSEVLVFVNGSYVQSPKIYKNNSKKYTKNYTNTYYNYSNSSEILLPKQNVISAKVYDAITGNEYKEFTLDNNKITLSGNTNYVKIIYTYKVNEYFTSALINDTYTIPDNYEVTDLKVYHNDIVLNKGIDYSFNNNVVSLNDNYKYLNYTLEYSYVYNEDTTENNTIKRMNLENVNESGYIVELSSTTDMQIHNYEIYVFDQDTDYTIEKQKYLFFRNIITDNLLNQPIYTEYSNIIIHTSDDTTWYNTWAS